MKMSGTKKNTAKITPQTSKEKLDSYFRGRDSAVINIFFEQGAGWKRFNKSSILRLLGKNELIPQEASGDEVFSYLTEREYTSASACRYGFEQDTLNEEIFTFKRTYDSSPICRAVGRFDKLLTSA